VIHTAKDDRLVVATLAGRVRIRGKDGAWQERQVSGLAPQKAAPVLAPARSR
jgi:hypothetical protein